MAPPWCNLKPQRIFELLIKGPVSFRGLELFGFGQFLQQFFLFRAQVGGVQTMTLTNWSPAVALQIGNSFISDSENFSGLSARGIFRLTFPSRVGTGISSPKAAWGKLMGKSRMISLSLLLKIGCSSSSIQTITSPAGPPLGPTFPAPRIGM